MSLSPGLISEQPVEPAFRDNSVDLIEKRASQFTGGPLDGVQDEEFWNLVRGAFSLDSSIINLNNGGCSPSPRVVAQSLKRQIDFANQGPSIFMWRKLDPEIEGVRKRLANLFGVDAEEMAITRNASESLMTCLFSLPMEAGDEILTTTQDYPRMINAIRQRERREGIKMVQIEVPPAPASNQEVVQAFRQGINGRTKIILVSHVVFLTGHINPVQEICQLGREHGIPVVVDGAHAIAHFPFKRADLQCDYYACSLHKWLMAPVGTGLLYVRKPLIEGLWALMAPDPSQDDNIRKFEEIGTHQAAVHNAIAEALDFNEILGLERKSARLRYLRTRWTDRVQHLERIQLFTNTKPEFSCGIATVGVKGIDPIQLASWLEEKHQIITAPIIHPQISGVRVSPQVYISLHEIDRFVEAMTVAATQGI